MPARTDTSDAGDNRVSGPLITFLFSRMLEKLSSVVILMQKSLCVYGSRECCNERPDKAVNL